MTNSDLSGSTGSGAYTAADGLVRDEHLSEHPSPEHEGLIAELTDLRLSLASLNREGAAYLHRAEDAEAKASELQTQVERLEGESHELTKALTGLTCSGSEFFIRKGERYVADITACVDWVTRRDMAAAQRANKAMLAQKAAEASLKASQDEAQALRADLRTEREAKRALRKERDEAREALKVSERAISEYYRYQHGGDGKHGGSYDGKPERAGLWAALQRIRPVIQPEGGR